MSKRASIKLHPGRGGWIHTTIAPIQDRTCSRFGLVDLAMFLGTLVAMLALARFFLAH
jgi:hypothetical protein